MTRRRAIKTSRVESTDSSEPSAVERVESSALAADARAAPVEFEWVPRKRLVPWRHNPKSYDNDEINQTCESIKRWGWGRPVQANRYPGLEGEIIAGHRAMLAAERLGDDFVARNAPGPGLVPVRWMHLPPKEAHALAMADNQHVKKDLDADRMKLLVRTDELDPLDWMTAGFHEKEIRALTFDPWPEQQNDGGGGNGRTTLKYSVIIECTDEAQQTQLLEWCESQELNARPWVG